MRVALWINEFMDASANLVLGGVQTYTHELAVGLMQSGFHVEIFQKGAHDELIYSGIALHSIPHEKWRGATHGRAFDVNIDVNPNDPPQIPYRGSIGIQHGVYWDRPSSNQAVRFLGLFGSTYRAVKGNSILDRYEHAVCVDFAFPNQATILRGLLDWKRVTYIPNFAPTDSTQPVIRGDIKRVVFCRRFVKHRGTRIFAEAMSAILDEGWDGEVHIIGSGPDQDYLKRAFEGHKKVFIYALNSKERLLAFDNVSLAVIPTISTEGTSLSCLEAWSKGALVLSTGIGGLSNLVIDNVNGVLVKPTATDLFLKLKQVLFDGLYDVARLRSAGYMCYEHGFNSSIWLNRWVKVIKQMKNKY